jgi:hypothetical protein
MVDWLNRSCITIIATHILFDDKDDEKDDDEEEEEQQKQR